MEIFNYQGGISYRCAYGRTTAGRLWGRTLSLPGFQIKDLGEELVEIIPQQECRYKVKGDFEIKVSSSTSVSKTQENQVVLKANQAYLLKASQDSQMWIDLDTSFKKSDKTVFFGVNKEGRYYAGNYDPGWGYGKTASFEFIESFLERETFIILPKIDLRCTFVNIENIKLPRTRMRNWASPPTKEFYPVDVRSIQDRNGEVRMSRAALGRGKVSLLKCRSFSKLDDGEIGYIIGSSQTRTHFWPTWAPVPVGFTRHYRITGFNNGSYLVTRPREQVSLSPGISLASYEGIPKFNRMAVLRGIFGEVDNKAGYSAMESDNNYAYFGQSEPPARRNAGAYDLLGKIMEHLKIDYQSQMDYRKSTSRNLGDVFGAFGAIDFSKAQNELIIKENDRILDKPDDLCFKFHFEFPENERMLFFQFFLREFFSNKDLMSNVCAFKIFWRDRGETEADILPLFVLYPLRGVETFINVARILQTVFIRLDLPSSGIVPRFSLPIEPTNRLFMVHGGGDLKVVLQKKGLLDGFFDPAYNYALPHIVTRDPSSPIMQFLAGNG
jgi:hypothetical protein